MADDIRALLDEAAGPDEPTDDAAFDALWQRGRAQRRRDRVLAGTAGVAVVAAMTVGVFTLARAPQSPEIVDGPSAPAVGAAPAGECPVTVPDVGFDPPGDRPARLPDDLRWYGTPELWTALPADGAFVERTSVWWVEDFDGEVSQDDLRVTWERLDDPDADVVESTSLTSGRTDRDGWFYIAGFDPTDAGCWQVTARTAEAELSFVYESDGTSLAASEESPDVAASSSDEPSVTPTDGTSPDPRTVSTVADDLDYFRSPSGNIACWFRDGGADGPALAECQIEEYDYTPIFVGPFEDSCEFDWGNILTTSAAGPGFSCFSDAYYAVVDGDDDIETGDWPVAEYGTTVARNGIECRSERTGVTCTDPSGNGFTVARAAYEFFGPDVQGVPAPTDGATAPETREDIGHFRTADGAIHCRYLEWFDGSLECLVTAVSPDAVPGAPDSAARSDCPDDQLQAFALTGGPPSSTCVGVGRYQSGADTPSDITTWPVIDDGQSVMRHGIRCDVELSELTCDGRDGFGFMLTPTTFTQFGPDGSAVTEP